MTPDFNSEEADIYIRSVRAMEKGGAGKRIYSRPAINREEAETARRVRTRVDRFLSPLDKLPGDPVYSNQPPPAGTCAKCGGVLDETCRIWRQVFTADGRLDYWICGHC